MEPFKNLLSKELVLTLAFHLQRQMPNFDRFAYEKGILEKLESLELKQRSQFIADQTHLILPKNHKERARILLAILHPDENDSAGKTSDKNGICGWGVMPLAEIIGQHGVDDFDRSMAILKEMTKRSSSEFAIRHFILADQKRALKIISTWVDDKNHHVRRLVSEGTRPRLPWAMQLPSLIKNPQPILPILKSLRDDESEYVRRSVANHLNDIAKDHSDLVGDIANDWMKEADKNRQQLIKHALRSLIKDGDMLALKAIGIEAAKIEVKKLTIITKKVDFGEKLKFEVEIISKSKKSQEIIIDYLIHFKKANGKLAPKVFKGSKFILKASEKRKFIRSHPIRKITTRKYYEGTHGLSLRINGKDYAYEEFELIMN